jgi:hypothetical protein
MPNSDILWQPASYEWHHHFCFSLSVAQHSHFRGPQSVLQSLSWPRLVNRDCV